MLQIRATIAILPALYPKPSMSNHKNVIAILKKAQSDIASELSGPQDQNHALRIHAILEKEINHLGLLTGTHDGSTAPTAKLQPATHILGEEIKAPVAATKPDLEPAAAEVETLKQRVEEAYPKFLNDTSKDIAKDWEDIVVRGVAKKAGLKVTKDEPKTITIKFVEEIKAAILEKEAADKKIVDFNSEIEQSSGK